MPALLLLLVCVALVVILIAVARMHPFLALVLAALAAGMLSPAGTLPGEGPRGHLVQAVELTTQELGTTTGKVGLVIALAALIGMCLSESGAADKIVRRFLAVFGEKRAGFALLASSYVLSIPIFFDTFFMLLVPLARSLAIRTGRDYVLYVLAISCGGMVTHSLVAPHPGPLAMAEILNIDLGFSMLIGLLFGLGPVAAAWLVSRRIARRLTIPVRPLGSVDAAADSFANAAESTLPSFAASILPILGPIALIGAASTVAAAPFWSVAHPVAAATLTLLGNRNVALLIGTACACALLVRRGRSMAELTRSMGPPLAGAGGVILIIAAGGAFGAMLKHAGVGDAVKGLVAGRQVDLVLLAWMVAAVLRIAQGSATVAMLTTAAMMEPILAGAGQLPYHPIYVFLAIGFGAMILSWMNDAGFWLFSTIAGFTERETLRTFTVIITVASLTGLVMALVLSRVLPMTG